jgi:hypothetical protein
MAALHTEQQILGALYVRSASSFTEGASALDGQRTQLEEYAAQDEARIVKINQMQEFRG